MHELRFAPLAADCVTVHDPLHHVMNSRTLFPHTLCVFLTSQLGACADDGGASTETSPPPTTAPETLDPSTTSTSDVEETTADSTSEPTTDSPNASTTTDGTTGDPVDEPTYCVPSDPADMVECAPAHRMWCDEVVALAGSTGIPQTYVDIVKLQCERGDEACGICFYVENTCDSLVGDATCDNVMLTCGCLAVAHGVL